MSKCQTKQIIYEQVEKYLVLPVKNLFIVRGLCSKNIKYSFAQQGVMENTKKHLTVQSAVEKITTLGRVIGLVILYFISGLGDGKELQKNVQNVAPQKKFNGLIKVTTTIEILKTGWNYVGYVISNTIGKIVGEKQQESLIFNC